MVMEASRNEIQQTVLAKVRQAIERYQLLQAGAKVVVGFSGGPDSTTLLHVLLQLQNEFSIEAIVAAHLHHGLRAEEADADLQWVIAHCDALGVKLYYEQTDVGAARKRLKLSTEAAAREARYAFLRRVAAEEGAVHIAVGHTWDDRVETILLHLLRGTGMEGLTGFAAVEGPIIRPLFLVRREETRAFCAALGVAPREDRSNQDLVFLRNRIRQELLPLLKAYYSNHIEESLVRMAEILSADNEVLEHLASEKLAALTESASKQRLAISVEQLAGLPRGLQRRIVRLAILKIRESLQDVGFTTIEATLEAIQAGKPFALQLPHVHEKSVCLRLQGKQLWVEALRPQSHALPWQQEVQVPGNTEIARNGWRIESVFLKEERDLEGILNKENSWLILLNAQNVVFPLRVRSRRPGDRIEVTIGKMRRHRKLQDVFVDAHIPREWRSEWPVLVDAHDRVLAVPGLAYAPEVLEIGSANLDAAPKVEAKNYHLALRFEASHAYR